jgi:hopanoid-associated phosphorylase
MGSDESATRHSGEANRIVAACGLKREADLFARSAVQTIVGGGARTVLEARLNAISHEGIAGIISIGICGALDPTLKVGDSVIASGVVSGPSRFASDTRWLQRLTARLPEARTGAIAGTDAMLIEIEQKHSLHLATAAIAADMESHVAAEYAAARGIPFVALRVVSDDARHALPPAVLKAMKPDGGINVPAAIGSVLRNPAQLPALLRTARDSEIAFRVLLRCLDRLGPRLLGPDFG